MRSDMGTGKVAFYPMTADESQPRGMIPQHVTYGCGACGKTTHGRIACSLIRKDKQEILWCLCSCEKEEPTILIEADGKMTFQTPIANEFKSDDAWPADLAQLYGEAAKSYSAGAHTACAMVCRKLLMATACNEGDADGKKFVDYVTFVTDTVLTIPKAKTSIDKIRSIGNEANHNVRFVSPDDARRAMQIVTYMLNAIYSVPA